MATCGCVQASSVSTADIDYLRGRPRFARMIRRLYGVRAPRNARLGMDVAGRVEAVGRGVTEFRGKVVITVGTAPTS
jgi:NADPH:quinone reductase-like Zn-dependent oxidoreductase